MPISTKLAGALLAPAIVLVAIAGLKVQQSRQEMSETRDQVRLVEAAMGPNGLTTGLHDERTTASLTTIGQQRTIDIPYRENEAARGPTNAALNEFRRILGDSPRAAEIYGPALDALGGLEDLRQAIDEDPGPFDLSNVDAANMAFNGYSELLANFLDANRAVALEIEDPVLRRGAQLSDLASRQMNASSHLARHLLLQGTTGPLTEKDDFLTAGSNLTEFETGQRLLTQTAQGEYAPLAERLAEDVDEVNLAGKVRNYLEVGRVDVSQLIEAINHRPESYYLGFRDGVERIIADRTEEMESSASRRFQTWLSVAVLTIVLAALVTWLVSRSITRPLRSLTNQATEMAERKLPEAVLAILNTPLGEDVVVPHVEPIKVSTRDEVADVADALNTVQDSALDLAVEQAVLRRNIADSFVNLGRRNQNLLGRQLDFITELEHNETDPDTLANLFRLDHLATRMRRNAESLLVLAGIDPPRKWAAPVRITDVIRAALGEVEDYQRVTVRAVEPTTIVGSAAADLAHLLAELIENALIFSPPDQTVEIRGRIQPAGSPTGPLGGTHNGPGGYVLAIIDSGLGMPPEELARANRRLAGAESFTIAPSKYLGHYVAGNLAARHNISVQLHNSPGHGITATINLPPSLLTAEGSEPTAAPTATPAGAHASAPGGVAAFPAPPPVPSPAPARPFVPSTPDRPVEPDAPPVPAAAGAAGADAPPAYDAPPSYGEPVYDAPAYAPPARTRPAPPAGPHPGVPAEPTPTHLLQPDILPAYPQQPATSPPAAVPGYAAPGGEAAGLTPSGLARRQPVAPRADTSRHDHLLQALANYTGRYSKPSSGTGVPGPATPPPDSGAWGQPLPRPPVRTGQTPAVPSPPLRPAGPLPGTPSVPGTSRSTAQTFVVPSPRPPATRSGLARRVRGAQLPTTEPARLRRTPPVSGRIPAVGQNAAKDVYSFLTDFTAGVQRGLAEAEAAEAPADTPAGVTTDENPPAI